MSQLGAHHSQLLHNKYKLGEVLGRGGWGTVYKGWDMTKNSFVAVKQVSLHNIPKEQLYGIMSEITLLQNLHHPRIVKYVDSFKTDDSLYIVLEYVENGSLERIISKFGSFPENLIAVYISQVLEGLVYLHEQGVIHRDIKAANILTTKEGHVKLADFGVAKKSVPGGEEDNDDPAGSPYWMAPEIIELNGATTKSDIWSVGCTIIELATGAPPYFDLDPTPALFKIVQDDCPPIPEQLTPLVKDFLMQCFQKETFLRQPADKLLKHRWISSNVKKAEEASDVPLASSGNRQDVGEYVQTYQKRLEEKRQEIRAGTSPTKGKDKDKKRRSRKDSKDKDKDKTQKRKRSRHRSTSKPRLTQSTSTTSVNTATGKKTQKWKEDNDEDDWGDDFGDDDKHKASAKPSSSAPVKAAALLVPDATDSDDDWDKDFDDDASAKPSTDKAKLSATAKIQKMKEAASDSDWDDMFDDEPSSQHVERTVKPGQELAPEMIRQNKAKIKEFTEKEDDEWDMDDGPDSSLDLANKLKAKLGKKWDDEMEEQDEDPFDAFEEDEEFTLEETLKRDEMARAMSEATKAIADLQPDLPEETVLKACEKLLAVFKTSQEMKSSVISQTGVIPFIEMLQQGNNLKVIHAVLKLVNEIIGDNKTVAESFCVMGGIPSTLQFSGKNYYYQIRQETAQFVSKMLTLGKKAIKMFIACRGLPVLVDLLDVNEPEEFIATKYLVTTAVECIDVILHLNLQIHIPKNDFCRLLAKAGLLPRLMRVFQFIYDDASTRKTFADKIADMLTVFSKADSMVKAAFCEPEVLKRFLRVLDKLDASLLVKVLKSLKTLSMSPTTLEPLHKAGALKSLVTFLGKYPENQNEIEPQVLSTLYNLCKLDRTRQQSAARAGAIPYLQRCVRDNSPLKQFALPLLYEMARVRKIRADLWKSSGVQFYLDMFGQQFPWQVQAVDVLAEWLVDEPKKVAPILEENVNRFIDVFSAARDEAIVGMLEPFNKMINASQSFNRALGASKFIPVIIAQLKHPNAQVRVSLLKILRSLFENAKHSKAMIKEHNLDSVVGAMESDQRVLVAEMARELSQSFRKMTRTISEKSITDHK